MKQLTHAQTELLRRMSLERPLDAYQLARRTGMSPMDVGRDLLTLQARGEACTWDAQGTVNDLACRFVRGRRS